MDRLHAIKVLHEVFRNGGFAAAARSMNTSPPTVSRIIAELEADLGVRLVTRSTRQLSMTEEGARFLRAASALTDELDSLFDEVRELRSDPRGLLRISSVVAFGQEVIAPAVPGFLERHPKVSVDLHISNRKVDLIQEHFDLAIRIGGAEGMKDSSLKVRRLFSQKLIFVASPAYVDRHGAPQTLHDLGQHHVVKQISGSWGRLNEILHDGKATRLDLSEGFVVNSPIAARSAVFSGKVIGLLAEYLVAEPLADGRLVRLLPGFATGEQPIYAVFVHRHYMPAKVRAFIDYIGEELSRRFAH